MRCQESTDATCRSRRSAATWCRGTLAPSGFSARPDCGRKHQRANDALALRQRVLAAAWAGIKAQPFTSEADFSRSWMAARAAALRGAGLDPYWAE